MNEQLKLPEVARRLQVSEKTARRYVKSGALPSTFVGGAYRVSEEDLLGYLEGAKVTPGGESPKGQAQRLDTEDAALAVLFRGLAQRGEKIVEQSVKEGASEQLAEELREYHREAAALHRITGGRDILGKRSEDLHEARDAYEEVEMRIQAMLAQDIDDVGEEVRTWRLRSKGGAKDARTEAS